MIRLTLKQAQEQGLGGLTPGVPTWVQGTIYRLWTIEEERLIDTLRKVVQSTAPLITISTADPDWKAFEQWEVDLIKYLMDKEVVDGSNVS